MGKEMLTLIAIIGAIIVMTLIERLKLAIATETTQGKAFQDIIKKQTELIGTLRTQNADLTTKVQELVPLAEQVPGLTDKVAALEAKVAEQDTTLAEVDKLLIDIEGINPTPVADAMVDGAQELPMPSPIVDEAPSPSLFTIPDSQVIDAAVNDLVNDDLANTPAS
jgi:hypothetical protein